MIVGIDASRNRSGGARAHLIGILNESNPTENGIDHVHLWSYKKLLDELPDFPWLTKHSPKVLEASLPKQVYWQYFKLKKEAQNAGCTILLSTDAGGISNFKPSIVMSRDMLSYEKGEMKRFGWSKARIRLIILKYVQALALKRAEGTLFLTKYASEIIQNFTGRLNNVRVIPHGVGKNFKVYSKKNDWKAEEKRGIRCIYVSNASMYKHQWHVIKAVASLKKKGYPLELLLVGGGKGKAQELLDQCKKRYDPTASFIKQFDFVKHDEVPDLVAESDIFIFASSCENMPNTLIEGMSIGMPIVCSDRGPMPEVLEDGGLYFDPENPDTIQKALEEIINNVELRSKLASRAKQLSDNYSWSKTGIKTWGFLRDVHTAKISE